MKSSLQHPADASALASGDVGAGGAGSAARYTPGPWVSRSVQPSDIADGVMTIDLDAKPRCWAIWRQYMDDQGRRCHRPVAEVYVVGRGWDEAETNARLIAAAPTLLEALVKIRAEQRDGYCHEDTRAQADAAIAAALGERDAAGSPDTGGAR